MPSPFPGMDPYLEERVNWPDVHHTFISAARAALNAILPSGFVARTEERIYIVEPDQTLYADVVVLQRRTIQQTSPVNQTATATIDPPVIYTMHPEEVTETYIEIIATGQNRRVVSVIELLSPANKSRGRGREEYISKRNDLLRSEIHLLEIDLLRGGEQTVVVPQLQQPGREYIVSLHRGDGSWRFETWGFGLRDRLPCVGVPLTEDLSDVPLDLQAVLNIAYDTGRYADDIDYNVEPRPTLSPADTEWADNLLRATAYRSNPPVAGGNGATP